MAPLSLQVSVDRRVLRRDDPACDDADTHGTGPAHEAGDIHTKSRLRAPEQPDQHHAID